MADLLSPAQAADLAATHKAAFTQSRPWSETEIADLLADRFTFGIGDARCFAIVRVIAGEAELLTIATHPDHQRQGLARALMPLWQAEAAARDATEVFLEVAEDNVSAQQLYLSCGFALFARRKAYYARRGAASVDALLMKRAIL